MSITIAEYVKEDYYGRFENTNGRQAIVKKELNLLSKFEEAVRHLVNDKSRLLSRLLDIEIFFFSKKENSYNQGKNLQLMLFNGRNKKKEVQKQIDKWMRNNYLFGRALEKTDSFINRRMEREPRIKLNMDDDSEYMDKAKFLTKFICFDGYMQYVDSKWDPKTHGINLQEFIRDKEEKE